jgi:hypothetical protein
MVLLAFDPCALVHWPPQPHMFNGFLQPNATHTRSTLQPLPLVLNPQQPARTPCAWPTVIAKAVTSGLLPAEAKESKALLDLIASRDTDPLPCKVINSFLVQPPSSSSAFPLSLTPHPPPPYSSSEASSITQALKLANALCSHCTPPPRKSSTTSCRMATATQRVTCSFLTKSECGFASVAPALYFLV